MMGNNSSFTDSTKGLDVRIHSDIFEIISFKIGIVMVTAMLYILILVQMALTVFMAIMVQETLMCQLWCKGLSFA